MFIYTVESGDTLFSLAKLFGLPAAKIAADNSLLDPSRLSVGQHLVIDAQNRRYILGEGQTLFSLSQEFGVPLSELIEANPALNPISLKIGEVINFPQKRRAKRRPAITNGYVYPSVTKEALECAFPFATFLSPFSYSLTPDGEIIPPRENGLSKRIENSTAMPLMTVTNIFDGSFSTDVLSAVLADADTRERLIGAILTELAEKNYYGVNLDMEYIAQSDKDVYNAFLGELSERLHRAGYILITAVAPKYRADQQGILYESHDYAAQGKFADYVIIMTYEWGYTYSSPMSVQPIGEVRKVLRYAVTEIPSGKILLGMPNYGYDWTLPYTRGAAAKSIGFAAATELAGRLGGEIMYDEKTATPYFNYEENGTRHVVWFDDPKSIEAKLSLADEFDLAGASWWTLNRCYEPNRIIAESLFDIIKM